MKIAVRKLDGSATEQSVNLKKEVFGIEPHTHSVYLTVKGELANRRQGSAAAKTRGEVSGSGSKPWRQKGTGRARVGQRRNPIWRGGGAAHGPKPRDFGMKVNRKVRALARRSVLSTLSSEGRIVVVDELDLEGPKTRLMAQVLEALELAGKKVMVLPAEPSRNLQLASRNIRGVRVKPARSASTYDLWSSDFVLIDREGIKELSSVLSG